MSDSLQEAENEANPTLMLVDPERLAGPEPEVRPLFPSMPSNAANLPDAVDLKPSVELSVPDLGPVSMAQVRPEPSPASDDAASAVPPLIAVPPRAAGVAQTPAAQADEAVPFHGKATAAPPMPAGDAAFGDPAGPRPVLPPLVPEPSADSTPSVPLMAPVPSQPASPPVVPLPFASTPDAAPDSAAALGARADSARSAVGPAAAEPIPDAAASVAPSSAGSVWTAPTSAAPAAVGPASADETPDAPVFPASVPASAMPASVASAHTESPVGASAANAAPSLVGSAAVAGTPDAAGVPVSSGVTASLDALAAAAGTAASADAPTVTGTLIAADGPADTVAEAAVTAAPADAAVSADADALPDAICAPAPAGVAVPAAEEPSGAAASVGAPAGVPAAATSADALAGAADAAGTVTPAASSAEADAPAETGSPDGAADADSADAASAAPAPAPPKIPLAPMKTVQAKFNPLADVMLYIVVFVGGCIGTALRFGLSLAIPGDVTGGVAPSFHVATFTANMLACFVYAMLTTYMSQASWVRKRVRQLTSRGVGMGMCGGFSTLSAMVVEELESLRDGDVVGFVVYTLASFVVGLAVAWLGTRLAIRIGAKREARVIADAFAAMQQEQAAAAQSSAGGQNRQTPTVASPGIAISASLALGDGETPAVVAPGAIALSEDGASPVVAVPLPAAWRRHEDPKPDTAEIAAVPDPITGEVR
ncbi:CrcB family protein [Bifidobacterium phasiani]|uniref:Fluoride-specific ion channel FluC n=1 Tax=Bifidobacterium phasiani TaxID=2834431 RepID=A0ABS6W7S8_9BIFI|nr:CrcB family protein [Bifidobacterium phasiani]MBW3082530.1 CrcB family protein [Bifidobacterium phasiani]